MDFDPITGKIWDTENGPSFGDETNLVIHGFNSRWLKIQGLAHGTYNCLGNPAKGLVLCGILYAMLCYAMLCYAMLCYARICHAAIHYQSLPPKT
jgi:hypothetical protein